ncbi:hypothetical protein Dsin_022482 [Dipteronia sinensis]|uniref:DUF8039 domain-containing protein n=1 Tax=Dipteronia sinensis TaxID=43782 RepID=A0AAE0A2G2_9ROSI|nr:hypothetical protein Dsin_022482 [Dipteronia sinensis]
MKVLVFSGYVLSCLAQTSKEGSKRAKRNQLAAIAAAIQRTRGRGIRIFDGASSSPHNTQPNTEEVPISPTTGGVASVSPTTDGSASVSHATERVPNVSPNEQGVLDESNTNKGKRKPRGRAKLSYLSKGKQLHVEFNTRGQPFGENAAKFSSLFGATTRELVPVTLKTWKDLAQDFRHQLWEHAQNKFDVDECHKKYTMQKMAKLWRDHISKVVKELRKKVECNGLNHATSDRFKRMKAKQKMLHTMSRKGYARLEDEMRKESETPDAITRVDVWIRGHTKKGGGFLNEDKRIEEANKNPTSSDKYSVKNDALTKALGPERRGRVRGLGFGATPSQMGAQVYNRDKVIQLEREVADLKKLVNTLVSGQKEMPANSSPSVSTNAQTSANHQAASKHQASSNLQASSNRKASVNIPPTSNLQGSKCKLLDWAGSGNVVALVEVESTNPQDLVHHVPLGPDNYKVWVHKEIVDRQPLFRPTRELFVIEDAVLSTIAWPIRFISFD